MQDEALVDQVAANNARLRALLDDGDDGAPAGGGGGGYEADEPAYAASARSPVVVREPLPPARSPSSKSPTLARSGSTGFNRSSSKMGSSARDLMNSPNKAVVESQLRDQERVLEQLRARAEGEQPVGQLRSEVGACRKKRDGMRDQLKRLQGDHMKLVSERQKTKKNLDRLLAHEKARTLVEVPPPPELAPDASRPTSARRPAPPHPLPRLSLSLSPSRP